MRWKALIQEKTELLGEARSLLDNAARTEAQEGRLDEIEARVQALNRDIEREERLQALDRETTPARFTPTTRDMEPVQAGPSTPLADSLPKPFRSFGEQLSAVARAAQQKNIGAVDNRLLQIQAAVQGASEGTASDGGFLVQTDFTSELLRLAHSTGKLLGKTRRIPIGANSNGLKINAVDETSRVDGSRWGGVRAYWVGEGVTLTDTQPKYRQMELTLQKLTGLYYATDELLMDMTALGEAASIAFAEEFGFKIDDALFRGTGAGMPLGVLAHAGTVSVAKETNQPAATILKANVEKMYARMWAPSLSNAEWHINQDCWPQLFGMSAEIGVGGAPVFLPPGGLSAPPFGTLLGRPILPLEQCQTVGTVGDIMLADWRQYLIIEKGGIEAASSIHVEFLTDQTVFRFILRMDGQPMRNAALTPFKGTLTQSSFVTLATRA